MVGVLSDDTDPMVTVMKLDKAPQETYADIGGLDQQIQEIKVVVVVAVVVAVMAFSVEVTFLGFFYGGRSVLEAFMVRIQFVVLVVVVVLAVVFWVVFVASMVFVLVAFT